MGDGEVVAAPRLVRVSSHRLGHSLAPVDGYASRDHVANADDDRLGHLAGGRLPHAFKELKLWLEDEWQLTSEQTPW